MSDYLTDAFIEHVRETYQAADPVFTEVLQEQMRFKVFIAMFKAALEVQGDPNSKEFIRTFSDLLTHFDKTASVIGMHQGLAQMVHGVLREHED